MAAVLADALVEHSVSAGRHKGCTPTAVCFGMHQSTWRLTTTRHGTSCLLACACKGPHATDTPLPAPGGHQHEHHDVYCPLQHYIFCGMALVPNNLYTAAPGCLSLVSSVSKHSSTSCRSCSASATASRPSCAAGPWLRLKYVAWKFQAHQNAQEHLCAQMFCLCKLVPKITLGFDVGTSTEATS